MAEIVLLDAGPLAMISHPRPTSEIISWLGRLVASGVEVLVPEIADYEVRRELLRAAKKRGLQRLDQLKSSLGYVPITTQAMMKAAEFWAESRLRGHPTANDKALDADVILAAQAATILTGTVVVATTNPRHLTRFVPAKTWEAIGEP